MWVVLVDGFAAGMLSGAVASRDFSVVPCADAMDCAGNKNNTSTTSNRADIVVNLFVTVMYVYRRTGPTIKVAKALY